MINESWCWNRHKCLCRDPDLEAALFITKFAIFTEAQANDIFFPQGHKIVIFWDVKPSNSTSHVKFQIGSNLCLIQLLVHMSMKLRWAHCFLHKPFLFWERQKTSEASFHTANYIDCDKEWVNSFFFLFNYCIIQATLHLCWLHYTTALPLHRCTSVLMFCNTFQSSLNWTTMIGTLHEIYTPISGCIISLTEAWLITYSSEWKIFHLFLINFFSVNGFRDSFRVLNSWFSAS